MQRRDEQSAVEPSEGAEKSLAGQTSTALPHVLEMINSAIASLKVPNRIVLEGVNWSVGVKDYWAIGGLHRSGKSDFVAAAAGLMRPVRGQVRLFGEDLTGKTEPEQLTLRLRAGVVFDGGQLLGGLTIAENVALPIRYHLNLTQEQASGRVERLLELTELEALAHQYPSAIGRNRQQRAGLARALALRPELLLLDNPLAGLDPRDAAWWLDLLDQLAAGHPLLQRRPVTLVVTADDLRPWRERASQFAVLVERRFVPLGTRQQLAAAAEPVLSDLLHRTGPGG